MGGCTSKTSSKKHDKANSNFPAELVFRRESLIYQGLSFDEDCPWRERTTYQDPSGVLPTEIKETVLQDKWFDRIKEPAGVEKTYMDSDKKLNLKLIAEDDHYDLINEMEMDQSPLPNKNTRTPGRRLPELPERSKCDKKKFRVSCKRKSAIKNELDISMDEQRSQCLEYSEMVNIFKPLIVNTLLVEDILPSLSFLDNHDDIYAQMRIYSPKDLVVSLLDDLERSEELGKWQKFIDALSANGYTYIVDNIRGYKFISPEYQTEYIRKLKPKIGKMIKTQKLLPHLLDKRLISNSDNEIILREIVNHGNFAAAAELLGKLNQKHRNWYKLFIEALQEANMDDVAVCLNIPELLESRRSNGTDICVKKNSSKLPMNSQSTLPTPNISKEEEKSQCSEFTEMVKIFKPLIVQNLLVVDILPSLPFLENHDDIYADMKNHSPKKAVLSLLDEMERSEELEKWQKFIDALVENGYTYIVDNIRGYKFISHEYQEEYIRKIKPKLCKMINTRELLLHLLAKNVISDSDNENIQRENANHGNIAAAMMLLDRIHKKHRNWYKLFIEALQEANMDDVAICLQIPDLLETNRTKKTDVCQNDVDTYYDDTQFYYKESDVSEYQTPKKSETCRIYAFEGSQDGNYTNRQFQKDQDDGDILYCIPPVTKDTDLDKLQSKGNLLVEDETTEQYEEPIPQRVPINEKRKVPLPIWTNADLEQFVNEVITLQSEGVKTDGNEALESKSNVESLRSKSLKDECEQMQIEYDDLQIQIDRLKEKASINEKLNTALRKVRELERVNELREKERQALKTTDLTTEDDVDVDADNIDTYYPTAAKPNQHVRRETATAIHDVWTKQTHDFREPFLLEACKYSKLPNFILDSTLSVVQVFSPTFDSRSIINQMFEQDSGVGTDMALGFD
ncbi:uncharacterized protein LOC123558007 isoform X1 [Mercenaria mercenaria]|uniref:uncharacterized protein LOC123558007 isoform X1 n=1 Tax=Mercenaria mercenaria TaxID=6596 RepID=UPI00234F9281|nr:uncharacterized protein LOC123558007 isoform X1 [Mercenaria mercenaria]